LVETHWSKLTFELELSVEATMTLRRYGRTLALVALATMPGLALAEQTPGGSVQPAFNEKIANIPGKSLVAAVVSYDPGGKTPPHRHAHSAFVTAYVLSGAIRSQVDGGKVQVFHTGESWAEQPGAHHTISENASATEPAKLLAIFVVDTNDTNLTTLDGQ
jgi:quercetin dioxygenase-like cupin family protein